MMSGTLAPLTQPSLRVAGAPQAEKGHMHLWSMTIKKGAFFNSHGPYSTRQAMGSLNPPIADDLSQLALPRHAVIVGFSAGSGGREVLLARRDGMHLDVSKLADCSICIALANPLLSCTHRDRQSWSASSQAPNARCCARKENTKVNRGYFDACLGMAPGALSVRS